MRETLDSGDARLIIKECKRQGLSLPQCAYVLATAWHETAYTMKPIKERGGQRYLRSKPYWPYYGRGYVQLTWKRNYAKAARIFRQPFVKNPDLVMKPEFAAPILVRGMKEGWFTGKKLSDYINDSRKDYTNARRIVNGLDRARKIAGHARRFEKLLLRDGYIPGLEEHAKPPTGLVAAWSAFIGALVTLVAAFWKEILSWLGG